MAASARAGQWVRRADRRDDLPSAPRCRSIAGMTQPDPAQKDPPRYSTFAEFWPFYLREHSRPRTRALHYIGTTLVVLIAISAVLTGRWWWLLAMPVAGYFFAWLAHFTVEKNRPATFTYPLWSLGADFKMWWLWLTGRLGAELRKAGVR